MSPLRPAPASATRARGSTQAHLHFHHVPQPRARLQPIAVHLLHGHHNGNASLRRRRLRRGHCRRGKRQKYFSGTNLPEKTGRAHHGCSGGRCAAAGGGGSRAHAPVGRRRGPPFRCLALEERVRAPGQDAAQGARASVKQCPSALLGVACAHDGALIARARSRGAGEDRRRAARAAEEVRLRRHARVCEHVRAPSCRDVARVRPRAGAR